MASYNSFSSETSFKECSENAGNSSSLSKEDEIDFPFYPVPWPVPNGSELFCKFCQISCNNVEQFGHHLEHGKHRMNVRRMEIQRLQEARDPRVFCSTCNLALHPTPMRDHLLSLKHLMKKEKEGCLSSEESEALAAAKSNHKLRSRRSKRKSKTEELKDGKSGTANQQHLNASVTTTQTQLSAGFGMGASSAMPTSSTNIISNFPDMVYAYLPQHLLFSLLGPVGAMAAIKSANEKLASLAQGSTNSNHYKTITEVVETVSNCKPVVSSPETEKKPTFACDICRVKCTSLITMNNHLDGYSHAKKAGTITSESKHWPRWQKERSNQAKLKIKWAEKKKEKQEAKRLKMTSDVI